MRGRQTFSSLVPILAERSLCVNLFHMLRKSETRLQNRNYGLDDNAQFQGYLGLAGRCTRLAGKPLTSLPPALI